MTDRDHRGGLPIRLFSDRVAFGEWLADQPREHRGLWMRFAKKGSTLVSLSKADAVDAALCYGWIDGQLEKYDEASWIVRFTPRRRASRWSQVNRERATALIAEGVMTPGGMMEIDAAKADGRWAAAYAPASRAKVPADLQDALDRAPDAAARFATLGGAKRYAALYRIASLKKADTRARRIADLVATLVRGDQATR